MSQRILTCLLFLNFAIGSCSVSQKVTFSWKNPDYRITEKPKKIFVAALVSNPHVRIHLEEEMGKAASKQGIQVERSWDYFPPTFKDSKAPTKEIMIDRVKTLDANLIFIITLIEKKSETRYIQGGAGVYGPFIGYGLQFRGFYSYWYPYIYDPGYYVTDKTYFMEGNLFDAKSEVLIWSVQTSTINPYSIEDFSKELVETMLSKAQEELKY